MKSFTIILASILLTCAVYNVGAANYANRVVAVYMHVMPEKTKDACEMYKVDGSTIIVLNTENKKMRKTK